MSGPAAQALRGTAPELLGPGVGVAVWGEDLTRTRPLPVEVSAVSSAVASRREEFHRGRACARSALARIGGPQVPIGVGPDREPLWPDGFAGAISHCGDVVVAVAARTDRLHGLGIDVERRVRLEQGVQDLVLSTNEVAACRWGPEAVLFFSAKESVHKTVFPTTRVWLDFQDVSIRLLEVERAMRIGYGEFRVDAVTERAESVPLGGLHGRWAWIPDHVVTAVRWGA